MTDPPPELAYYYTDWIWPEEAIDQVKALLLFFDGVALALPANHFADVVDRDPVLAQPLLERGLLHNFDPVDWMTGEMAFNIRRMAGKIIDARGRMRQGSSRSLQEITGWHFISPSERVDKVLKQAQRAGLISERGHDDLVYMPAESRAAILAALAQVVRHAITGVAIQPVAAVGDDPRDLGGGDLLDALAAIGMPESTPSFLGQHPEGAWRSSSQDRFRPLGEQFLDDLTQVGIPFGSVPLDYILGFRASHGREYQAYARDLRGFMKDLSVADPYDRLRLVREREEMLADRAADLRKISRSAFSRPAAEFALSLAGAAWTLTLHDPIGAIIAAATAVAGFSAPRPDPSPYTYLFKMEALPH